MRIVLAITFLTIASLVAGAQDTQEATVYIDHQKIAAFAANGKVNTLIDRPGFMVRVSTHGSAQPELHVKQTHVLTILDGEATFVSGGTLVGFRKNKDGVIVGGTDLQGGQEYHLKKGDVIMVLAGIPHWWKEVPTKTVTFYNVFVNTP
ncbi:MAG TPA: cupin domain-containing protein [Vicinamibacterales bacterium]|nr:cupin domain-containing protein [Vicinamibacterales bacterium]